MSDEPEVIPPTRGVPAVQKENRSVTAEPDRPLPSATTLPSSLMTGFRAELRSRAAGQVAKAVRAETEALDALTDRHKAQGRLLRAAEELTEIPETIGLDKARRKTERAVEYARLADEYAKIEGSRQRAEEDKEEHAHQEQLKKLRRQKETEEAERAIVEARRDRFNSDQGFENQRRLKQVNLEIWESRKKADLADAERVRAMLHEELEEKKKSKSATTSSLEQLQDWRETLVKHVGELAADGRTDEAEIYRGLIFEIDQTVSVLRGQ